LQDLQPPQQCTSESSNSSLDSGGFSVLRKYGIRLRINPEKSLLDPDLPTAIDVETDEKDNFVGIAISQKADEVEYFSVLPKTLSFTKIIGHNIKGDWHWLEKWGIKIAPENIYVDTMIMSYVLNPTSDSHGLKQIGKEFLNLEWPKYKEMTHTVETRIKGKKNPKEVQVRVKHTLNELPVESVANYCGMDAIATFRVYRYLMSRLSPTQLSIVYNLEMPILKLLFSMENHGLMIDTTYLGVLDEKFSKELGLLEKTITEIAKSVGKEDFNPRSPKQVVEVAQAQGIQITESNKKALEPFKDHPFISTLFSHRAISKLYTGYIKRFKNTATLPNVYPIFSQVSIDEGADTWKGIRTGRLSSDYHNIPRRSEEGSLLRRLFVAPEGQSIICGDYSQIEYRLLAHFTKEPMLIQAFKEDKDVHEETAKLFGSTDRDLGKTLNFAAIYGAQAKKIAYTAKISETEAQKLLDTYWRSLRRVTSWINRIKFEARQKRGVRTMCGRWIPIPDISSDNPYERWHAERQSVNYVIQGSAADIIKSAMLSVDREGYSPILQVHDELLFLEKEEKVEESQAKIKELMESAVKLEVPLSVDLGSGHTWQDAKG
jgi:DNA polymerase I